MSHDSGSSGSEEESDDAPSPLPGHHALRFIISPDSLDPRDAIEEFATISGEIPNVRRLLDRVLARLGGQSVGRLDALLLQVLLARVSLAEMQYQHELHEAVRLSLEENQNKPTGPPPALDEDVSNCPMIKIATEHLQCTDKQTCVICLQMFTIGDTVKQLPCSHIFCEDCIVPWLQRHRTCPLCREEVVDVDKQIYSFDVCGFRQLDPTMCHCTGSVLGIPTRITVLPGCSHAFNMNCMRANIWKTEPGPTALQRMIRCPLCDKPSAVKASLIPQEYKGLKALQLRRESKDGASADNRDDNAQASGSGASSRLVSDGAIGRRSISLQDDEITRPTPSTQSNYQRSPNASNRLGTTIVHQPLGTLIRRQDDRDDEEEEEDEDDDGEDGIEEDDEDDEIEVPRRSVPTTTLRSSNSSFTSRFPIQSRTLSGPPSASFSNIANPLSRASISVSATPATTTATTSTSTSTLSSSVSVGVEANLRTPPQSVTSTTATTTVTAPPSSTPFTNTLVTASAGPSTNVTSIGTNANATSVITSAHAPAQTSASLRTTTATTTTTTQRSSGPSASSSATSASTNNTPTTTTNTSGSGSRPTLAAALSAASGPYVPPHRAAAVAAAASVASTTANTSATSASAGMDRTGSSGRIRVPFASNTSISTSARTSTSTTTTPSAGHGSNSGTATTSTTTSSQQPAYTHPHSNTGGGTVGTVRRLGSIRNGTLPSQQQQPSSSSSSTTQPQLARRQSITTTTTTTANSARAHLTHNNPNNASLPTIPRSSSIRRESLNSRGGSRPTPRS